MKTGRGRRRHRRRCAPRCSCRISGSERFAAENEFEKAKLQLARAIGLPLGAGVHADRHIPYAPLADAHARSVLKTRLRIARRLSRRAGDGSTAAEASRRAADGDACLPSLHLDADYGAIGQTYRRRAQHVSRRRHRPRSDLRCGPGDGQADRGRRRPAERRGGTRRHRADASSTTSAPRCSICAPPASSSRPPSTNRHARRRRSWNRRATASPRAWPATSRSRRRRSPSPSRRRATSTRSTATTSPRRRSRARLGTAEQSVTAYVGGVK